MKRQLLIPALLLLFLPFAQGKVKLPAMMGDHMVLQLIGHLPIKTETGW